MKREWRMVEQNDKFIVYESEIISPSKAKCFIAEIHILEDCDLGQGTYEKFFQTFSLIKDTPAQVGLQFFINAAFGEDQACEEEQQSFLKVFEEKLCFLAFETEQCTIGSYMLYRLEAKKNMIIGYQSSCSWTEREKKVDERAFEILESMIGLHRQKEKKSKFNFEYFRKMLNEKSEKNEKRA